MSFCVAFSSGEPVSAHTSRYDTGLLTGARTAATSVRRFGHRQPCLRRRIAVRETAVIRTVKPNLFSPLAAMSGDSRNSRRPL